MRDLLRTWFPGLFPPRSSRPLPPRRAYKCPTCGVITWKHRDGDEQPEIVCYGPTADHDFLWPSASDL